MRLFNFGHLHLERSILFQELNAVEIVSGRNRRMKATKLCSTSSARSAVLKGECGSRGGKVT